MSSALDRCTALLGGANMGAFLRVIREGETNQTDDAYRMAYGGALIDGPEHPWYGRTTTEVGHSTAYGAYQFLGTSWKEASDALGLGNDTSPINQSLCAVWTIDVKRHATAAIQDGNLALACSLLKDEWVSLPNLGPRRIHQVFTDYGGTVGADTTALGRDSLPSPTPRSPDLAATPQQPEKSMAPLLFLPAILEMIPSLVGIFGKGERGQQNAQAAQIVVDAFKAAVPGAINEQDAVQKVQADPALKAQVKAAVMADPNVLGLVEVGGGVGAARTANLALVTGAQKWWQLVFNPVFLVTLLTLPLVYMFTWGLMPFLSKVSSDVISQTMGTIIGLVLGSVMGFWMGQTYQANNRRGSDTPAS